MKSRLLMSLLCVACLISPAFSEDADKTAKPATVAGETATQASQDGKILEVLTVLNNNEIDVAKLAIKKTKNANVKEYAEFLLKEHKDNLKDGKKLSKEIKEKPLNSEQAKTLKQKGKAEVKSLAKLKGEDFDKAFIQAMVQDHQEAISLLDNDLLKNVTNASLKDFLNTTHGHLATHLDKAKALQS